MWSAMVFSRMDKKQQYMNEVIFIQQDSCYITTIKVDKSVKRFAVEFNGSSTKVTNVVVELKEDKQ